MISIHAPLRERRFYCINTGGGQFLFQSTLPCGSDRTSKLSTWVGIPFQSTLPCGSDHRGPWKWACLRYFNPRSLAGATSLGIILNPDTPISIHAPLRERQHQKKILLFSFKSSIYCELAQLKYSKILF